MSKKELKTNAMRLLDRLKIPYEYETYECDEFVSGVQTAEQIGLPHEQVYKTLVTISNTKEYLVYMIPVEKELDLKKCAKVAGVKSCEMIHVKDINKITGYIRGGCSPLGMKKQFRTFMYEDSLNQDTIYFSAGKIGMQIEMDPKVLVDLIHVQAVDIIKE